MIIQNGVEPALKLFEAARARTTSLVSGLSQKQMDFTPGRAKWSIGENVDHLLLSEKTYRYQFARLIGLAREGRKPVLQISVREINFAPFFLPKSLLPMVAMPFAMITPFVPNLVKEVMIRYPLLPAQNPDVARPAKGRPAETLHQELAASIQETTTLLLANADLDYRQMITRHALIGVNSVVDLLRILAFHEQRHHGQMLAIRNSSGFQSL